MQEFSSKIREIVELAEKKPSFYEVEISFHIRLQNGNETYFLRLMSDSNSIGTQQANADPHSAEDWF